MNLVVDAGNTRMKYAFFRGKELLEAKYGGYELLVDIEKYRKGGERIDLLLSGSGKLSDGMKGVLSEAVDWSIVASSSMDLPLRIGYATPDTLGFDRIAICTGAMGLFPGYPLLVIDSGTCITFNYVDAEGVFLGGNISPGLDMRFQGLHHFTARLPLVQPVAMYGGMGCTTEEAIRNGVMDGMLFEVNSYISKFLERYGQGRVVVTGGNSVFLENRLPEQVVFCKMLGFLGLNDILMYSKKYSNELK